MEQPPSLLQRFLAINGLDVPRPKLVPPFLDHCEVRALKRRVDATLEVLDETLDAERLERELTFVGLVGILDPPRAEVKAAVAPT